MKPKRVYLSPPHLSGYEQLFVQEAFESNWIAPLGPHVDAFEQEFAHLIGSPYAAALSSGTAGLHLAMILAGVGRGDEVLVSTFTFSATVNPIIYQGAQPVFIDSERESWNIDPHLLSQTLQQKARQGKLPKAVVIVHLYGQTANLDPILDSCRHYNIPLIEDAAEALGATYKGKAPGTYGQTGIFSFNGNKVITTSGGGMLVSPNADLIAHARKLATQARDFAPHYQHSEIGYNYRLSNILAAIGRGQLKLLSERVAARRQNFDFYLETLGQLPGIQFMPEAPWGEHSRWLTTLTIDPQQFGVDRETVRLALEAENIESRPLWKPMHLQPIFAPYEVVGGAVSADLFEKGLCLPSGSNLTQAERTNIVEIITSLCRV